jgi:hypothetical protein
MVSVEQFLVEQFKLSRPVLALVSFGDDCGILRIAAIVRDGNKADFPRYYINASDVVVSAETYSRTNFISAIKDICELPTSCGNVALPSNGRMIYCSDDILYEFLDDLNELGRSDVEKALLPLANDAIYSLERTGKFASENELYARVCLLEAAKSPANIELLLQRKLPTDEPILQSPEISRFCADIMNNAIDVVSLLSRAYEYFDANSYSICAKLLQFVAYEPKRNSSIIEYAESDVIYLTEYLTRKGILEKTTLPISIAGVSVDEIAYISGGGAYEKKSN